MGRKGGRLAAQRGTDIEDIYAATKYKGWFRIGSAQRGFYKTIDFVDSTGRTAVSLKTLDPTGKTAKAFGNSLSKLRKHIRTLGTRERFLDPATKRPLPVRRRLLDLTIPAGFNDTKKLKKINELIEFGKKHDVRVYVNRF